MYKGGEQPLSKNSACNLASINLSEFVIDPYTDKARFDFESFKTVVMYGIRYLDNVIDYAWPRYPLKEQQEAAQKWRNCGLGVLGYATMLMKLGITYGSQRAKDFSDNLFYIMFREAVWASSYLAQEKGNFPGYNDEIWNSTIIKQHYSLPSEIRQLKEQGLRNCSVLSIAPTGSIATLIGESGGIEPEFAISYTRRTVGLTDNQDHYYDVYCKAAKEYMQLHPEITRREQLPKYFISSAEIDPIDRVEIQGIIQKHIDTGISSTVNLKQSATVEDCMNIYIEAWKHDLKGITIFRDGCKRLGVLTTDTPKQEETNEQPPSLQRGDIISCDDSLVGKKRKIISGCGSAHILAYFDPYNGDLMEVYIAKGSTGGCNNTLTGLSRMISLLCRAGVDVYDIKDQLDSTGACPSYAVRSATKHDTSKGSCCPMAIGNALVDMWEEMQRDLNADESNITFDKPIDKTPQNDIMETEQEKHDVCPECGEPLVATGGCWSCPNCSFSYCG